MDLGIAAAPIGNYLQWWHLVCNRLFDTLKRSCDTSHDTSHDRLKLVLYAAIFRQDCQSLDEAKNRCCDVQWNTW